MGVQSIAPIPLPSKKRRKCDNVITEKVGKTTNAEEKREINTALGEI